MQPLNKAQDWYVFWKMGNNGLGSERAIDEQQAQGIASWHERNNDDEVLVLHESQLRERLFRGTTT